MAAEAIRLTEATRYGAYACLSVPPKVRQSALGAAIPQLAERLHLRNEFDLGDGHPHDAIAFLRRVRATPADIADENLLAAEAVVHIASAAADRVQEFCDGLARLLGPEITLRFLTGVVRPRKYTGNAMYNFAYAHRVSQRPGTVMPNAFLIPIRKTAGWWEKDWMERHTYFLPHYDEAGHMLNQGHALAAAAGITCLMRRTYWNLAEPAPEGAYDFITYFECANKDIPRFHEVCGALRDIAKNPEWIFVQEGPTWQGRRVATWAELFD